MNHPVADVGERDPESTDLMTENEDPRQYQRGAGREPW